MKHTPRIYINQRLEINKKLILEHEVAHHLGTVLRLKPNSDVIIFNGLGGEFSGKIISIERKQAQVEIKQFRDVDRESPVQIELIQSVARNEKMDWIIQKAVELGVACITPVWTEFSNAKIDHEKTEKRLEHWQKIIVGATEQSGRCKLMQIKAPQRLNDWFTQNNTFDLKLVCHPVDHHAALTMTNVNKKICVLIGPEGGLSENEVQQAQQHDFKLWSLGPRILRAETAAVAAIAVLQSSCC